MSWCLYRVQSLFILVPKPCRASCLSLHPRLFSGAWFECGAGGYQQPMCSSRTIDRHMRLLTHLRWTQFISITKKKTETSRKEPGSRVLNSQRYRADFTNRCYYHLSSGVNLLKLEVKTDKSNGKEKSSQEVISTVLLAMHSLTGCAETTETMRIEWHRLLNKGIWNNWATSYVL